MKYTNYFLFTRQRADRSTIKDEWIEKVFYHSEWEEVQPEGRIRRWAYIEEVDKYLRLVILEDKETIHNAFFDSSFLKKII